MENTETSLAIQLTPFETTKETLISLASDYKNMVVTRENLKEANEARLVLYRKRIEIQNVAKANRKTIKDFLKNNNDAIETELIEVIEPTELDLEDKIKKVKDAIAEEERIEAARVDGHKQKLQLLINTTIECANSTDLEFLTNFANGTRTGDLEEFSEEANRLFGTLKETAKNRLEMLEFQAKKKAGEEAAALKLVEEEKAKKEAEGKEAQKGFDMSEPPQTIMEVASKMQEEVIEIVFKINQVIDNSPKLSPLKTVPIGAASENPLVVSNIPYGSESGDKYWLTQFANSLLQLKAPICDSKEGKQHVEFLKNMLEKLAAQTIKVAEKL